MLKGFPDTVQTVIPYFSLDLTGDKFNLSLDHGRTKLSGSGCGPPSGVQGRGLPLWALECIVLKDLVGHHRTVQLSFFSISGWGIDLDYCDIELFAFKMNKDYFFAEGRNGP